MTVFNTLITEDVRAFTTWETDGDIKSVSVVDDDIYTLTERVINSVTQWQLDVQYGNLNTDSAVVGVLSSNVISNMDHLEGKEVRVKIDGAVQPSQIVIGGQIIVGTDTGDYEAGLNYSPYIQTMPLNIPVNQGPNWARKKKITRIGVQSYLSNGVIASGQAIPDKTIGNDQFDSPSPQTQLSRVHVLGWTLQAQVEITQDTPMPWHILSIAMEVAV